MATVRKNNILEKNRQGKKGLGCGLIFPSAEIVELIGMVGGFDYINLDGEHGLFSPESIDAMCRAADGYGLTVTARVPNLEGSRPSPTPQRSSWTGQGDSWPQTSSLVRQGLPAGTSHWAG